MNAGKSMALLQVAHNYEEQGMNVVLFTSDLDNRYGHANIASRLGVKRKGLTYTAWTNFYERLKGGIELFLDDNQVVDEEFREYIATTAKPIACVLIDERLSRRTVSRCGLSAHARRRHRRAEKYLCLWTQGNDERADRRSRRPHHRRRTSRDRRHRPLYPNLWPVLLQRRLTMVGKVGRRIRRARCFTSARNAGTC